MMFFDLRAVEGTEPVNPTVDPADIRGLIPPDLHPSGACRSRNAVEGDTTPGLRLFPYTWETSQLNTFSVMGAITVINGL